MLVEELQKCKFILENVETSIINCSNKINELNKNIIDNENKLKNIVEYKQFYRKAVDIIYERSIKELTDVLNSALSYIFFDQDLELDIVLSDKRGKAMNFVIKQNNNVVSLKKGMGMGVKCVISCILHIYYLQCKKSNKLFLDEAYSNISKEYISRFFEFLTKLCEKLDFTVVMITHDERFLEYAKKVYEINKGNVKVTNNE